MDKETLNKIKNWYQFFTWKDEDGIEVIAVRLLEEFLETLVNQSNNKSNLNNK